MVRKLKYLFKRLRFRRYTESVHVRMLVACWIWDSNSTDITYGEKLYALEQLVDYYYNYWQLDPNPQNEDQNHNTYLQSVMRLAKHVSLSDNY